MLSEVGGTPSKTQSWDMGVHLVQIHASHDKENQLELVEGEVDDAIIEPESLIDPDTWGDMENARVVKTEYLKNWKKRPLRLKTRVKPHYDWPLIKNWGQ